MTGYTKKKQLNASIISGRNSKAVNINWLSSGRKYHLAYTELCNLFFLDLFKDLAIFSKFVDNFCMGERKIKGNSKKKFRLTYFPISYATPHQMCNKRNLKLRYVIIIQLKFS